MNKILKFILSLIIIPLLLNLIANNIQERNQKISLYYLLIPIGIILLYYVFNYFIGILKSVNEKYLNFDDIKGDLEKKAALEVIPNSLLNTNTYVLNDFSQFNISRFTPIKESGINETKYEDLAKIINSRRDSAIILLGNSGLGKTTFSRWLTSEIAHRSLELEEFIMPHIFFLYDFNNSEISLPELIKEKLHYQKLFNPKYSKLVFILDGLNEIHLKEFKLLILSIKSYCNQNSLKYSLIITSRPLSINNEIFNIVPQEITKYFFTILPWSGSQIKNYLQKNGISKKEIDQYSDDLLKLLSTPLFAFIFVAQKKVGNTENFKTVQQVIESYIKIWVNPEKSQSEYYDKLTRQLGVSLVKINKEKKVQIICELSFYLTENRITNFNNSELEIIFNNNGVQKHVKESLLTEMINFGIITSTNEMSFASKPTVLRLRHQIFQEFLTAKYLLSNQIAFPLNISNDMFWKDIPKYAILQITTIGEQNKFVSYYVENGDYLTAIRISKLLSNEFIEIVKKQILSLVIDSFTDFDSYGYSSEVLLEIGKESEQELLKIVLEIDGDVIAPEELGEEIKLTEEIKSNLEKKWRRTGRAIHMLNEIQSNKVIDLLNGQISKIKSNHLIYHILEYILKMTFNSKLRNAPLIISIIYKLRSNKDIIIRSYSVLILSQILMVEWLTRKRTLNLNITKLLQAVINNSGQQFLKSFWIRNHGIECLSETVTKEREESFYKLLMEIIEKEEIFEYPKLQPFYFAVHTSIFKALINLNRKGFTKFSTHYLLLLQILNSKKINTNMWALRCFEMLVDEIYTMENISDLKCVIDSISNDSFFLKILKSKYEQITFNAM